MSGGKWKKCNQLFDVDQITSIELWKDKKLKNTATNDFNGLYESSKNDKKDLSVTW